MKSGGRAAAVPPPTWWMQALAVYCVASLVFLVWRDLYLPQVRDVEVWFGFEARGRAAELSAPLHWILFVVGAWGFWREKAWILPSAAGYSFYIGFSHLVWNQVSPNGSGWPAGIAEAILFSLPGVALLRVRRRRLDEAR